MRAQKCPLCEHHEKRTLFSARDYVTDFDEVFCVVECLSCGTYYTDPVPEEDELKALYERSYPQHLKTAASEAASLNGQQDLHAFITFLQSRRSDFEKKSVRYDVVGGNLGVKAWVIPEVSTGCTGIELGCGNGQFIKECTRQKWNMLGLDMNPVLSESVRNNGGYYHCGTIDTLPIPAQSLDAVFAWQVIEHIPLVRRTLKYIFRLLKPGGSFCFSVPNAACWQFRVFKDYWAGLQVPTHVTHFTLTSLSQLILTEGFVLDKVWGQQTVGCLIPSIKLKYFGEKKIHFGRNHSMASKLFDRLAGMGIAVVFGKNQCERITVACRRPV